METPSRADISFDEVKIKVKEGELFLIARPLVHWSDTKSSTHWNLRAKLSGPLNKLHIKVERPEAKGQQAFIKAIVREVMKDVDVRQTYSVARHILSKPSSPCKLPTSVEVNFTVKDEEEWEFSADIDYPSPVYTMIEGEADNPEDA